MLEEAWNTYRGWAARSRQMQAATHRWNRLALAMAVAAAVLGTAASQVDQSLLAWVAAAAALASAVSGWLGREALALESEAKWVKARAVAEAIKSECFRYAAGDGPYAAAGADDLLARRVVELKNEVGDLTIDPLENAGTGGGSPRPEPGMTVQWYLDKRLEEQRGHFARARDKALRHVMRLRMLALAMMAAAVVCGAVAGFTDLRIAAWTAVITTISTAIVAAGMNDRARAIAAAASRMINRLSDIRLLRGGKGLAELVRETENALRQENAEWIETMQRSRKAAAAAPGGASATDGVSP